MLLIVRYLLRPWRQGRHPANPDPANRDPENRDSENTETRCGGEPEKPARTRHAAPGAATRASTAAPGTRARNRPAVPPGPLALLLHQTRYELLTARRNPRARFLTLVFPVVMLVIFAGVFHGTTTVSGVHVKLSRYFTAGILAMSIVLASYANLVTGIATMRETGVLKRRRAAPVPPVVLIGAQAVSAVTTVAIMSTILLVVARLLYGISMAPGAIAAIAFTAALGGLAFAAIGYAVSGLISSPDAAQPIVQATTMPLWFLSGVLIPTQNLSSPLRSLGAIFPVERLAAGLHLASTHSSFVGSISVTDLLVLAAWGAAAAAFATWRFSWLPSTASR